MRMDFDPQRSKKGFRPKYDDVSFEKRSLPVVGELPFGSIHWFWSGEVSEIVVKNSREIKL